MTNPTTISAHNLITSTVGFEPISTAQAAALGVSEGTLFTMVEQGIAKIVRVDVARNSTTYRLFFL